MSKRYGRQQKRKASERIAQLENSLFKANRRIERDKETVKMAASVLSIVRELCPDSTFSPPNPMDDYANPYYLTQAEPCSLTSYDYVESDMLAALQTRQINLYELKLSIGRCDLPNMMHYTLTMSHPDSKPRTAYIITEAGMKYTPTHYIASQLVEQLKGDLK